jgi:hypothetical protein
LAKLYCAKCGKLIAFAENAEWLTDSEESKGLPHHFYCAREVKQENKEGLKLMRCIGKLSEGCKEWFMTMPAHRLCSVCTAKIEQGGLRAGIRAYADPSENGVGH